MNGHVIDILGAYLDGELSSARRQKVEAHLSDCPVCRLELESLRGLTNVLQAAPVPEFTPVEKFASNLALQLPRQPQAARSASRGSAIWWIVPLVLLAAWIFLQIVFRLGGYLEILGTTNFIAGANPAIPTDASHAVWFTVTIDLFGKFLGASQQTVLAAADQIGEFAADALGQFLWQAGVGVAYILWLVVWWQRRESQATRSIARSNKS